MVSREEILVALWGVDYVAESNIVGRQIRNLRATTGRLAAAALHRYRAGTRLPVLANVPV